jgi:hypothetical protein
VQAPSTTATADLSLDEFLDITGTIVFGTTGTGEPANITPIVGDQFLSISGVGQLESTSISIVVYDDEGSPIPNPTAPTSNNIKVTFSSQPNGGEFISGVNAAEAIDDSILDGVILVRTIDGTVTINLQTGTLPGVIELRIEVLFKNDGTTTLDPLIIAQIPQISVASGPPHTIALSTPVSNSVENLANAVPANEGFYRRRGTLIVTDRFGNAVADNTVINLGIVDSVIVEGTDGDLLTDSNALTSPQPQLTDGTFVWFDTATISRNGNQRFVQEDDLVLITDTNSSPDGVLVEDKARFVGTGGILSTLLPVQTPYLTSNTKLDYNVLDYVVGAALLGAEIAGYDPDTGVLSTGSVTTVDGLANIRMTYPANTNTIHVGCGVVNDTRHEPEDSAQVVYTVATSTTGNAAMVEGTGKLCFASIAPWAMGAVPSLISGNTFIDVSVADGGDGFALPFIPIGAYVLVTTGESLTVNATTGISGDDGIFTSEVTMTGAQQGDAATITYYSAAASVDVSLSVAGAIPPWSLVADTSTISTSGTHNVVLTLTDDGTALVAPITAETNILYDPLSDLIINVSEGTTDASGKFTSIITIIAAGADTDDIAIITFTAGEVSVDVLIEL